MRIKCHCQKLSISLKPSTLLGFKVSALFSWELSLMEDTEPHSYTSNGDGKI